MDKLEREALIQSCRTLLRPVASLLLRGGMTWREFAGLAREVFVEVATDEYGIRGRKTNISRVAILTGLGRREVGRLRRREGRGQEAITNRTSDATRVLSGWHQDRAFRLRGKPAPLPVNGARPCFDELARRYAPDVPPSALLKELRRVGAVETLKDGRVRAVRRYYMPGRMDAQWLLNAGSVFHDLGTSINHNLGADPAKNSRFIGRAADDHIDAASVPEFRALLEKEGQQFLERMDDWLARHRIRPRARKARGRIRLGVGLFAIQNDIS